MKTSKPLAVLFAVLTAAIVLTGSIAVPILCRPFYYAHITAMDLPGYTGLSEPLIREAFDDMLDFCIGKTDVFSTGILPWSSDGRAHFADVRVLFLADLWTLGLSLTALAVLLFLCRRIRPYRFLGRGPGFWAATGLSSVSLVLLALAASDFDRAFTVFHALFFPGKDNWIFDWEEDPIILLLPEEYFRNCAILILAVLLTWCAILILTDLLLNSRHRRSCSKP